MRPLVLAMLVALGGLVPAFAQTLAQPSAQTSAQSQASKAPTADALLGVWTVDLRPEPSAPPYLQAFEVTRLNPDQTFEGRFYGAPVSEARINTQWGAVRIAFVTRDGAGAYHHAAVLRGDTLEGLTNATGRGFLAYWSAVKASAPGPRARTQAN